MGLGRAAWIAASFAMIGAGGATFVVTQRQLPESVAPPSVAPPPTIPAPPPTDEDLSTEALFLSDGGDDHKLLDPDTLRELGVEGVVTSLSDLGIPVTKRTMRYVKHFGSDETGRRSFGSRFARGHRFRTFVERELLLGGLPQDLVWVAAIESGFRPEATSPKGAMGLFQFMPETGAQYGLLLTQSVDERRSIPKSTRAAIAHFDALYARFGSWDLSLAAYNCGEGRVEQALDKARVLLGEREDPILFHDLAEHKLLPRETLDYVPMIHAFAIVAHNRAQLDLDALALPEPMSFGEVAVPLNTPLATVALAADVSIADLREYNPDLLTDTTGDGEGDTVVLVPAERLSRVNAALPALLFGKPTRSGEEDASEDEEAGEEEAPVELVEEAAPPELWAVPNRPNTYLLGGGVMVVFQPKAGTDVTLGATVTLRDPTKPDPAKSPLSTHTIEARTVPLKKLRAELEKLQRDVVTQARSVAGPKLYANVLAARKKRYDDAEEQPFALLSGKMFRLGHPLHGALLVGPTRGGVERIVDVEPFWAVETVLTLEGAVSPDKHAEMLLEIFKDPLAPRRLPRLPDSSHVRLAPVGKEVLLGWGAHPFSGAEEAAADLAFLLACDDRVGRVPALLRDRRVTQSVSCGLEKSPGTVVAWFRASPSGDEVATTLERAILEGLVGLTGLGPSEDEIDSASDVLRADLARRLAATRSDVERRALQRDADRVLGALAAGVSRDQVLGAARRLFATKRRVLVTWDR
jgi:hypothetical protein